MTTDETPRGAAEELRTLQERARRIGAHIRADSVENARRLVEEAEAVNEAWLSAGEAMLHTPIAERNVISMVKLLRSDAPIPPEMRNMLAELLDPNSDGYLYFRLNLVNVEDKRNNFSNDIEKSKLEANTTAVSGKKMTAKNHMM